MGNIEFGKLYIIATPIGNMKDITYRAIETLKSVDVILAEDTRNTKKVLLYYNINNKIISYHEFNKFEKEDMIVEMLKNGKNVGLVTDAGTPIISDPGFELVRRLKQENLNVESIPGPCAVINSIVLSGIDCKEFIFLGFLPKDNSNRRNLLEELKNETRSIVIYVSPHSLLKYLNDFIEIFNKNRIISICREMTKIHEDIMTDTIENLLEVYKTKQVKGEIIIVVSGIDKNQKKEVIKQKYEDISIKQMYQDMNTDEISEKELIKKIAKIKQVDKNVIYKIIKVKE